MNNNQQEGRLKSREDLLNGIMTCTCDVAYKSRGLASPDCAYCNYSDDILRIMQEYHNQFQPLTEDQLEDISDKKLASELANDPEMTKTLQEINITSLQQKLAEHLGVNQLDTSDAYAVEWTFKNKTYAQ